MTDNDKKYKHLTIEDREIIEDGLKENDSISEIARKMYLSNLMTN